MQNSLASETKDCFPTRGCDHGQGFRFAFFADSFFGVEDITENDWMKTFAVPFGVPTSPSSGRAESFRLTRRRRLVQNTSRTRLVEVFWI
jgi:hypothetical protein